MRLKGPPSGHTVGDLGLWLGYRRLLQSQAGACHSALSHWHIEKLEAQLKAEIDELFAPAEPADQAEIPDGISLSDEIKHQEDRLAVMAKAKASDQINLTGEESRIMPVAGGSAIICQEEIRRHNDITIR